MAAAAATHERHYGFNGTYRLAVRRSVFQAPASPPANATAANASASDGGEEEEEEAFAERTRCLPYHAPSAVVEAALAELEAVRLLGGATVTRDGDPTSPRWGFGYALQVQVAPVWSLKSLQLNPK